MVIIPDLKIQLAKLKLVMDQWIQYGIMTQRLFNGNGHGEKRIWTVSIIKNIITAAMLIVTDSYASHQNVVEQTKKPFHFYVYSLYVITCDCRNIYNNMKYLQFFDTLLRSFIIVWIASNWLMRFVIILKVNKKLYC